MIGKIGKVLCGLLMILSVIIMYLKALDGEHITEQIIWIVLLFVVYKLIVFGEKKGR